MQTRGNVLAAFDRTIAGNDNHGNARLFFVDFAGEFQAVHALHAKVGDEDIKILVFEFPQSFLSVVCAHGTIALHLEDLATESCQDFMIVNKKDGFHERTPLVQTVSDSACRRIGETALASVLGFPKRLKRCLI